MNSLFIANCSTGNSVQVTGASIPFDVATFFACSGFTAGGVATFNSGRVYVGNATGYLPYSFNSGTPLVISPVSAFGSVSENLNKYFVATQNAGEGVYVLYN